MFGFELIFVSWTVSFLAGLFTVIFLYWYSTRNHDHWEKKNVPYVKAVPLLGSVLDTMKRPLHEVEYERYLKLGSVYGHYRGNTPHLSVGDPALLRDIMVKDFGSFTGRRIINSGDKIVDNMLTVMRGEDWKRVRSIVSPTFTTGKIKRMLGIFKECTGTLMDNFKKLADEGKPIDLKSMYGAFAMDVIASSAFSTKINSHDDPENQFVQMGQSFFNRKMDWKLVLHLVAPKLMKLLNISISQEAPGFFRDMTLKIIEERKRTGQRRNDFLQLLMDTAKEVSDEEADKERGGIATNYELTDAGNQIFKTVTSKKLSLDELVAQSVIFFVAGYDTTASTLSFATYLLALNQDVQDRLREEVDAALEENKGELSYEALQNMKYLDNVISETLRYYSIVVRLERLADTDYTLGDTGIKIDKGTIITVPVFTIHRNPKYWPNPEKFDPDRFSPEERAKRDPYAYMPFGAGPRSCVGMRFALIEIKECLAHIIANFKIVKHPQTKVPLEFDISLQGLLKPKEVVVGMEVRKDSPLAK